LIPQARGFSPPYASNQIQETAKHIEVLNIYHNASPQTRRIYDLGREWNGTTEDNWIIRWCLWHVFRYRDERNRSRNVAGSRKTDAYYPARPDARQQERQEQYEDEDENDNGSSEEEEQTQSYMLAKAPSEYSGEKSLNLF
jgi:hypothetical protein